MATNQFDELSSNATPLPTPARVLTIGAHPDDAEFGAGATLARWADDGASLTMCIVTDGSKGSWNPNEDQADLVQRRTDEQQQAGAVLGASKFVHLGHTDGELEATRELRNTLAALIREVKPSVVLTHDPWQRYQLHPDHRATGISAVDAVVSAREPLAATASDLPAHRPNAVLLWSADAPDHAEPVSPEYEARKIEALLCHASQAQTTMADATDDDEKRDAFVARIQQWHQQLGEDMGTEPAETFKRLTP